MKVNMKNTLLSRYGNTKKEGEDVIDLDKVIKVYRQCQRERLLLDVNTGSFIIKEFAKYLKCNPNKTYESFMNEIRSEMSKLRLTPKQKAMNCILEFYGCRDDFKKCLNSFHS